MRTRSKLAVLSGVVMVAGGLVTGATAASASTAAAASPCGSGYGRVGVYAIPKTGARKGTLEVYYSSKTGKNCALAYGYGATYNHKTYKSVLISVSDGTRADHDYGQFSRYAGPVYVSAPHKCIDVSGWIVGTKRVLSRVHCS
ncbi:hypothetical protein ABGB18_43115 [Nonomuraea sp. B12E4]|uniref:hypothetical protein n=1 Tax=Nonomuraea sp. B12E4 TaxID=3153564 RepID=UPI00325F2B90